MGHLSRWLKTDARILLRKVALGMAVLLAVFTVYDISHHLAEEGKMTLHAAMEGFFLIGLAIIIIAIGNTADREFLRAERELESVREELEQFRSKNRGLMTDFRHAVQEQFDRWGFTPGERQVAEKLILGFSFREVAAQLEKKEKTVRNQSQALYDKAGMTGRHDLAAFFLQDILGPDSEESIQA